MILLAGAFACKKVVDDQEKVDLAVPVAEPLKMVQVAPVAPMDFSQNVYAIGRLGSKQESKLSFKTGGLIKSVNVTEGQKVSAGTVLALLDMEEINAQVQKAVVGQSQAEIQYKSALVMVEKLERDFEAVKALYADKVATLTELQDTKSALDNAKNQVEAAKTGMDFSKENQKIADYNKRLSRITAPSSGVILKKMAETNELVGPGSPVFLFGSSNDALVLKTNITDKDIVHMNLGNRASVKFDAYPGKTFNGKISELAGIADPYTGTYEVEISISNPANDKLLSGFIGEASIGSNNQSSVLAIPLNGMLNANGRRAKVYTVKEGIVQSKNITIGSIEGDQLIVLEGLEEGEMVITKGANYVSPSDSVNTEIK